MDQKIFRKRLWKEILIYILGNRKEEIWIIQLEISALYGILDIVLVAPLTSDVE